MTNAKVVRLKEDDVTKTLFCTRKNEEKNFKYILSKLHVSVTS